MILFYKILKAKSINSLSILDETILLLDVIGSVLLIVIFWFYNL